jgi:hypothetical protein
MKNPYLIMAVLDIIGRMEGISDYRMHQFFRKLYFRWVDYLRVFLFCSWGPQGPSSQPYLKLPNGKFDLKLFNPNFFDELKRLADMAYQWKVALYVDLFDNCALGGYLDPKDTHPYENNVNGVKGMYDESPLAQDYRNKLAAKVIETIGLRGKFKGRLVKRQLRPNLFGLINEGKCTDTKSGRDQFGGDWAYPLASFLRKAGYDGKIMFSAYDPAAHAISGWVSSDEHWQSEFRKDDTVRQIHGIYNTNKAEEACQGVVHGRWFATSTDGTFKKNPDVNGIVNIMKYVIDRSKEPFGEHGKKQRYYHHHEELPLSISEIDQYPWEIDAKRDLEVYSAIRRKVFGIKKPNRKPPKWLLKRTGLIGG